jgi:hypothetical protein
MRWAVGPEAAILKGSLNASGRTNRIKAPRPQIYGSGYVRSTSLQMIEITALVSSTISFDFLGLFDKNSFDPCSLTTR